MPQAVSLDVVTNWLNVVAADLIAEARGYEFRICLLYTSDAADE